MDIAKAYAKPSLSDLLDLHKTQISRSINCVQIGQIEVFNPANNTATVSISMKAKNPKGELVDYPTLVAVPTFVLNGGGASLTFPIVKGDPCIILFNDRSIDKWWLGNSDAPESPRAHALSDAFALVGVRNTTNPITVDMTSVVLNAGAYFINLKNQNTTLRTILIDLVTKVAAMTMPVSGASAGPPSNALDFTGPSPTSTQSLINQLMGLT